MLVAFAGEDFLFPLLCSFVFPVNFQLAAELLQFGSVWPSKRGHWLQMGRCPPIWGDSELMKILYLQIRFSFQVLAPTWGVSWPFWKLTLVQRHGSRRSRWFLYPAAQVRSKLKVVGCPKPRNLLPPGGDVHVRAAAHAKGAAHSPFLKRAFVLGLFQAET